MSDEVEQVPAVDPLDDLRARAAKQRDKMEFAKAAAAITPEVLEAEQVVSDERRGLWADAGVGAARAVPGAVEETFDLVASLDESMMSAVLDLGIPDIRFDLNPFDGDGFDAWIAKPGDEALPSMFRVPEAGWESIVDLIPETERASGAVVEGIGKFIAGFATGKKSLQALRLAQNTTRVARVANAVLAGGMADALVFDGHDERLSNFLTSFDSPILNNAVTQYLAADEDDTELEGRMKGVIEGAGLGLLFDSFIIGIRGLRRAHANRRIKAAEEASPENTPLAKQDEVEVEVEVETPTVEPIREPTELDVALKEGVVDAEATASRQPPVAEGFTRLYRAESPTVKFEDVFDVEKLKDFENTSSLPGQRYTDSVEYADYFRETYGRDATIKYIDVPTSSLDDVRITDNEFKIDVDSIRKVEPEAPRSADNATKGVAEEVTPELRRTRAAEEIRGVVQLTEEQTKVFIDAVAAGDETVTQKMLSDFNEKNIDWDKIESAEDIKNVLLTTERYFAELTDMAKGGVQSNAQTKRLGQLVGANGSEVDKLFQDVRGGGGIAARFYAAQRIMLASGKRVVETARIAKDFPADTKEAADALRAIQMHVAIQAEIKGAQTEIARALQAMGMIKDAAADNFKEFAELRKSFGSGSGDRAWNRYMDDMLKSRNLDELNTKTRNTGWQRMRGILIEFTINAMLSSPKTHIINLTSNVLNTFIYSFDRFLGGSFRYLKHGDQQALREARIDIVSKLTRLDEALKLAKQAWKDGMPVVDKRQRMEFGNRMDIARNGDSWLSNTVNWLGKAVRTPGRALIAGDEFFKAVTRNSETSVLAFRKADEEALAKGLDYGSEAYEEFVKKRMRALSDPNGVTKEHFEIQQAAIEKSRFTTFQESALTDAGASTAKVLNSLPLFKLVIAPFFKTPANIIRQGAFDRTPLGLLFKSHRKTLREAHPREVAELQARMTTGVAAMATFYAFTKVGDDADVAGFQIVGKIPYDSSARLAGVKDYSIRIGDHWFQFNRLEPMGMWIGMMADMRYAMEYSDDPEAGFSYGQAAFGSFMNNVTNKTWARSFTDMIDLFEDVQSGRKVTIERAWSRFAAGEFGKLIPQFVKAAARGLEGDDQTFAKEAWSVLDIMGDRSSLWGKQPLKHDLIGRPIPRDSGFSILLNPFTHIKESDDPVDKEFFRLGFVLAPMAKTLGAGGIDLTVEEYSKLTGLVAETGLHQILTGMVTSEYWPTLNNHMQTALLKERVTEARTAARAMLLADGDLAKRVAQSQVDAALLLTSED